VLCTKMLAFNDILSKCDTAIMVMGISGCCGAETIETEGQDRTSLDLPGLQEKLVMQVLGSGVVTVLVLLNGGPLTIRNLQDSVPAIVEMWYSGQAAGPALAEVLFGDYSPAGRLPNTWYNSLDDIGPITNYSMAGRTYRFFSGDVIYPFGYGLSYSKFQYSNLLVASQLSVCDGVTVNVTVTNVGDRNADEVVQLYITDLDAPFRVPLRQLQGFTKVRLAPRESRVVLFYVLWKQLAVMRDIDYIYMMYPGKRTLWVGGGQPQHSDGLAGAFSVIGKPNAC